MISKSLILITSPGLTVMHLSAGTPHFCHNSTDFFGPINGTGISPETRVSLLGNINTGSYFRCEESGSYGEYYSILYAIETLNPKHPYVWACALIFALCLLSSYVFYISYEESKVETVK